MINKEDIIDFCKNIGLNSIGFLPVTQFDDLKNYLNYRQDRELINEFEGENINERVNPKFIMEDANTIISFALPYNFSNQSKSQIKFSRYTLGDDYHLVVGKYLRSVCEYIKKFGYKATFFVDSNTLPERYIAMKSGVGFIGKNNCLITKKYGSYVFLGEILTNLKLQGNQPMKSLCGTCKRCIDICPTKAINGSDKNINNNGNICISYLSQKKILDEKLFYKLGDSVWGCDKCQEICPFNCHVEYSNIEELRPKDYMINFTNDDLSNMDNEDFKNKFKSLACGWRGKNLLIRNALICEYNTKGYIDKKDNIISPYIKEYYDKLLKMKKL